MSLFFAYCIGRLGGSVKRTLSWSDEDEGLILDIEYLVVKPRTPSQRPDGELG